MDHTDQTKSTEKHSQQSSDGKNRRRPSLFPIRNSAKRKGSFSEDNLFDPHKSQNCQINHTHETSSTHTPGNNSDGGQTQFQYKTPSQHSNFSSPRTPRSSSKQFDTPFVPFVHQSLSRTAWQSEQVIPQQKYEYEKKQSQTQINNQQCPQIQDKDSDDYVKQKGQQDIYPQLDNYQSLNPVNHIKQQQDEYQQKSNSPHLKAQIAISITIPSTQKTEILQSEKDQNQNDQFIIKQEPNNDKNELISQISHQLYISKANIYYQKQKQKINTTKNFSKSNLFHQSVLPSKKNQILSFSYLQCISIRPSVKQISQYGQQSQSKILKQAQMQTTKISPISKNCNFCQTQINNLKICNNSHSHIQSVKKSNQQSQTSFSDKLKIISQKYQQKIGISRSYVQRGQQTYIQTHNCGFQTQQQSNKNKNLMISQQINVSMNYDYGKKLEEKVDRFEKYIKSYCDSRQSEIQYLRNRKFINQEVNTQNYAVNATPSHSKNSQDSKKSIRSFGCQYDIKDAGNRSSLKRVSIADTKIIYIEDSNSTETFDKSHQKRESKNKNKSKLKQKVIEVKMEQEHSEQIEQPQQYIPPPVIQEQRKSKRKASKTPAKKKSKR